MNITPKIGHKTHKIIENKHYLCIYDINSNILTFFKQPI